MNALIAICTLALLMQYVLMTVTMNMIIIVDAIERHDEVAETAMRQHINNAFIFKSKC